MLATQGGKFKHIVQGWPRISSYPTGDIAASIGPYDFGDRATTVMSIDLARQLLILDSLGDEFLLYFLKGLVFHINLSLAAESLTLSHRSPF